MSTMTRNSFYNVQDRVREPLYVIAPIFNQLRWKSRWKHYETFAKEVVDAGATLYTIEAVFGGREPALDHCAPDGTFAACPHSTVCSCGHEAAKRSRHKYIAVRTDSELWIKENLINQAVARLPHDWKYVAWVDADVTFLRPNWVGETIQQLQHYAFLQMFSHAIDLDPLSQMLDHKHGRSHRKSFAQAYIDGDTLPKGGGYYYGGGRGNPNVWTGLAWACTRRAWDAVGGLMDFCIHGGGDWHTAFALIGRAKDGIRRDLHSNYKKMVFAWEALAEKHIRRNIGVMTGTVAHRWHGSKGDRRYAQRHQMLAELKFDPMHDLKYDWQGALQLVDHGDERSIKLRDMLREHARARNEDSIHVG
jgi:hypothetical protein